MSGAMSSTKKPGDGTFLPPKFDYSTEKSFEAKHCSHPGCSDKRTFEHESVLRKHMNKHIRPYKCGTSGCEVKDFGTVGDLKRHKREVHSSPLFTCPVVSCSRHQRGFGRKHNLRLHMKRIHTQDAERYMSDKSPNNSYLVAETINSDGAGTQEMSCNDHIARVENRSLVVPTIEDSAVKIWDKYSLSAKLEELEAMKMKSMAKFNEDIAAVKRVLSIL